MQKQLLTKCLSCTFFTLSLVTKKKEKKRKDEDEERKIGRNKDDIFQHKYPPNANTNYLVSSFGDTIKELAIWLAIHAQINWVPELQIIWYHYRLKNVLGKSKLSYLIGRYRRISKWKSTSVSLQILRWHPLTRMIAHVTLKLADRLFTSEQNTEGNFSSCQSLCVSFPQQLAERM